jgi:ATP-dependent DNA helicase RecQ
LEAECVLLYSAADVMAWKRLLTKSVEDSEQPVDPEYLQSATKHLNDMDAYCRPLTCRHKGLVEYFGQEFKSESCQACDVCLDDATLEALPDAQTIAKKILSCVGRVDQRFGVGHVVSVLRGDNTEGIRSRGHDKLSTYGLLKDYGKNEVRDWVYQLVKQQVLVQTSDEYPILQLNEASWQVIRDEREAKLLQRHQSEKPKKKSKADVKSWEGVDRTLFDALRSLCRNWASQKGLPPWMIFSDATLRELARVRPSSLEKMRMVYGIGDKKLEEYGSAVLAEINRHCQQQNQTRDCGSAERVTPIIPPKLTGSRPPSSEKQRAMKMFHAGKSVPEVAQQTGRAVSTIYSYLSEFVRDEQPVSVEPWIHPDVYKLVSDTIERLQPQSLKPVYVALDGKVSYDEIRIVMIHRAMQSGA